VSIIVPTYRNPKPLDRTLRSLLAVDYPHDAMEIVVVDDGSGDGTANVVRSHASRDARVRLHEQPNGGAARARNAGAQAATGEIVLFVDDDMLVPADLIRRHLRALEHFAPAMICGFREFAPSFRRDLEENPFGRYRLAVEPRQEWGEVPGGSNREFPECCLEHPGTGGLTANNLAVPRRLFLDLGGFDESFPAAGYEDQELSMRARAAGIRCLVDYGNLAWHFDQRTTFEQFLKRQRRGAATAVLIAHRHPEPYARNPFLLKNRPVRRDDPPILVCEKLTKLTLSRPPLLGVVLRVIDLLERRRPRTRLLPRLYRLGTGLHLFLGVRDGYREFGAPGIAGGDARRAA
jgi:GT2 family glycosyltransferase